MTIFITYVTSEKDEPVRTRMFENVGNPGLFANAFLQINENGTNRVMEWIPMARIVNIRFENNSLTGVQLAH